MHKLKGCIQSYSLTMQSISFQNITLPVQLIVTEGNAGTITSPSYPESFELADNGWARIKPPKFYPLIFTISNSLQIEMVHRPPLSSGWSPVKMRTTELNSRLKRSRWLLGFWKIALSSLALLMLKCPFELVIITKYFYYYILSFNHQVGLWRWTDLVRRPHRG